LLLDLLHFVRLHKQVRVVQNVVDELLARRRLLVQADDELRERDVA
jgi:hypothetical protein